MNAKPGVGLMFVSPPSFGQQWLPGLRDASRRSWVNVGPPATTLAQHGVDGGLMRPVRSGGGVYFTACGPVTIGPMLIRG